jgi:hypothetical protein
MDQPRNQLILNINNSRPIAAAGLGRLLTSMGSDYRQATGRPLVVTQLERGSIVAVFQEAFQNAAALADSVNHLIEFAKNIGTITLMALGGIALKTKIFGSGGEIGSRTVESIAKVAIAAGATVELYSLESPKPVLIVTPTDGTRIRKFATQNKKLKKPSSQVAGADRLASQKLCDSCAGQVSPFGQFPLTECAFFKCALER